MPRGETESVRVDLGDDDAEMIRWVKKERGLTMNTELFRLLLKEEFKRTGGMLMSERFEEINSGVDGVKILDRKQHRIVDVYFKPEGVMCSLDQTSQCEHVDFALSKPHIRAIIQKHVKNEGWKLPNV